MAIKVIVELQAKSGQRAELAQLVRSMAAQYGPQMKGWAGSALYEVPDSSDLIVEIADWESLETREAAMKELATPEIFGPLMELLAAPFKATVVKPLA